MAHVRDCDTSLWLHNKLGTSTDLWIGNSICSQLNKDVLRNIKDCFIALQSQVKLKLLLSFLHLPRRNVDEWKNELQDILELALLDTDQWVSILAELLKSYPNSGGLFLTIEENSAIFTDVLADLKKQVRKHTNLSMMPLECLYLNKTALNAVVGQHGIPIKHFALKRKPKSATLRAELLQKASDTTTNVKKSISIPSMAARSKGLYSKEDKKPMKGIPSRSAIGPSSRMSDVRSTGTNGTSISRSNSIIRSTPAGKKDGGIKLLDINEQPIGYGRDAKRRRKLPENETISNKEKDAVIPTTTATTTTPEYAAGLLQNSKPLAAPATPVVPQASMPSQAPTYIPPSQLPTEVSATSTSTTATMDIAKDTPSVPPATTQQIQDIPNNDSEKSVTTAIPITQFAVPSSLSTSIGKGNITYTIGGSIVGGAEKQVNPAPQIIQQTQPKPPTVIQPVQQPQAIQAQPQQKKALSLTKEQMCEAQEMFRTSNKVTRPEKALILGFMAGSRENPCPHLGNVINITLSEDQENAKQFDGTFETVIVETLFQMNYGSGEWKRIKRYKKIQPTEG